MPAGAAGPADVDDHLHVAALDEVVVRAARSRPLPPLYGVCVTSTGIPAWLVGPVDTSARRTVAVRHRDRDVGVGDDCVLRGRS